MLDVVCFGIAVVRTLHTIGDFIVDYDIPL